MAISKDILRAVYVVVFVGIIFIGYLLFTSQKWAIAAEYYAVFAVVGIVAALSYDKIKEVKFR